MRRLRPVHVGWLLLGASLLLVGLNVAQPVRPIPDRPDLLAYLRLAVGLPVVLLVPGWFLVPALAGRDADRDGGLDPGWAVLFAVGMSLAGHVLHFNLLRGLGLPIEWPALGGVAVVECAVGAAWWRARKADLEFAWWDAGTARGVALGCACVVAFSAWSAPSLLRDGSWYFFEPDLEVGWAAAPGVTATWGDGAPIEQGAVLRDVGPTTTVVVDNPGPAGALAPLLIVVHAPVGTTARLTLDGHEVDADTIARVAPLGADGPPVERYWAWGSAALAGRPTVPGGGELTLELTIEQPADAEPQPLAVAAWAGQGSADTLEDLQRRGFRQMHPFQLLNVTENIRWADEVAGEFVLAGRSPDGSSTLHQPPAWTYLYAPARELLTDQTVAAGALLVFILLMIPLVGLLGVRDDVGSVPAPALGLVLGLAAAQHGRLMVSDGSLNFPDSLYALALVIAVVALSVGRVRVFVLWALLAALLRYPGAVVIVMAGGLMLLLDPSRRRRALISLARFGLILAMVCGVMLVVGALSGSLQTWFFALYFETVPEHFNNNPEALPWLARPPEFLRLWALFGGGVALLALPLRGRLSKLSLGTALAYFPFLAFIDHFSHHYFLPLVGLAGVATCASIARIEDPARRRMLAWAAAAVALGLAAAAAGLRL